LVNRATPESKTADGFESQFGVNHLSHFLLFQMFKPTLLASSTPEFNSRVVCVASSGHRGGPPNFGDYAFEQKEYTPFGAYAQSKSANIYMANEIERRYGAQGLHGLSLHPGGIATGLQVHVPEEKKAEWAKDPNTARWSKSPAQGASTMVYAAVSKEWEGKGGRYLEDCKESPPAGGPSPSGAGYAPHAYDPEGERRLWADSLKMVGLEDSD
jgi:NAD(P)-dependent dehydrogenase (short-subunit alcohol dehydrogenase family)